MKIVLSLLAAGFLLAGCQDAPSSGIVTSAQSVTIGEQAPDITFVSTDGRETTLNAVRSPVTIVAFVEASGADCCEPAPAVVGLANRYSQQQVTVVQVAQPVGPCPHGSTCMQDRPSGARDLIALCDPRGEARQAYGNPPLGQVYLIDSYGQIAQKTTLDNLDPLLAQADPLALAVEDRYTPSH